MRIDGDGRSRESGPGTAIADLVAADARHGEIRRAFPDAGELARQVDDPLRDEVHHVALTLDAAGSPRRPSARPRGWRCRSRIRALLNHALRRTWQLANEDDARRFEPAAVASLHHLGSGGGAGPAEGNRRDGCAATARCVCNPRRPRFQPSRIAVPRPVRRFQRSARRYAPPPPRSGKGSSRNALIAHNASRRPRPSADLNASASASWTSATCGTSARRQRLSIEANN